MVKMELLKIETQRLLLRQFAIGDAEDVFAILSDEQTTLDCGGYMPLRRWMRSMSV